MTDTILRLTARIRGHHYQIDFPANGYREVCYQISRLKRDGCPLTWFDMIRLRAAAWELIKAEQKRKAKDD